MRTRRPLPRSTPRCCARATGAASAVHSGRCSGRHSAGRSGEDSRAETRLRGRDSNPDNQFHSTCKNGKRGRASYAGDTSQAENALRTGDQGLEPQLRHPECRVLPITPIPNAPGEYRQGFFKARSGESVRLHANMRSHHVDVRRDQRARGGRSKRQRDSLSRAAVARELGLSKSTVPTMRAGSAPPLTGVEHGATTGRSYSASTTRGTACGSVRAHSDFPVRA
jgi:hypothetical protein